MRFRDFDEDVRSSGAAKVLWSRLSRFLEYPELELSNNLAENAMRSAALGRRNWIHVGSKEAGPRIAAINFDRRTLSSPEPAGPRLPPLCPPGLGRLSDQSSR
jgi:Transposase IS66 family